MVNNKPNRIAVLLNDAFADWETGFLSSSVCEFFGGEVLHFSKDGREVLSEGTLRVIPSGSFNDVDPAEFQALIVCGSSKWMSPNPVDISELLLQAEKHGTVIGAICGGTLTAARAGLLDDRRHTSNGPKWLPEYVATYRGAAHYQDVNDAISDRGIVTAPGSAPVAFAREVLSLLYPDHKDLAAVLAMLAETR